MVDKNKLRGLVIDSADDLDGLEDDEIRWLIERSKIPAHLVDAIEIEGLHEVLYDTGFEPANTGTVRNISTDELEAELERRRSEQEDNPNKPDNSHPHFADEDDSDDDEDDDEDGEDGDDDEGEEDYLEGWTNETRRVELSKRGLSVSGKQDDMVARLIRSDKDELIEGDKPEAP